MTDEAAELSTRGSHTSESSRGLSTSNESDCSCISQHNDATKGDQIKPLPVSDGEGTGDQIIKADDRLSILFDADWHFSEFTTDR